MGVFTSIELVNLVDNLLHSYCDKDCESITLFDFNNFEEETEIPNYAEEIVSGMTKGVVVLNPTYNYVIKVPFCAYNRESDTLNDNCINDIRNWDYCHTEELLYNYAKEWGIEEFFAKTEFISERNSIFYYKQEKVIKYNDSEEKDFSEEEKSITANITNSSEVEIDIEEDWLTQARLDYGNKKFELFLKFLDNYGINDLHCNNYGYSAVDGRTVLLDFSGYFEQFSS
jgi:hypothetical protein